MTITLGRKKMYKLEIVEKCEKIAVIHYVDERGIWGTKGRKILFRKPSEKGWQIIAKFPFVWEDVFGWNRLASRALRSEKCIVYPTELGKLLGIRKGKVYDLSSVVQENCSRFNKVHKLRKGLGGAK